MEIMEAEPEFSNLYAVPSYIGQGTHNYTTVGLARYVTTVANSGTCYNLSILDKLTDSKGNVIEDYTPEVRNTVDLDNSLWNAIHSGMRQVVEKRNIMMIWQFMLQVRQELHSRIKHVQTMLFLSATHHMRTRRYLCQSVLQTDILLIMRLRQQEMYINIIMVWLKKRSLLPEQQILLMPQQAQETDNRVERF